MSRIAGTNTDPLDDIDDDDDGVDRGSLKDIVNDEFDGLEGAIDIDEQDAAADLLATDVVADDDLEDEDELELEGDEPDPLTALIQPEGQRRDATGKFAKVEDAAAAAGAAAPAAGSVAAAAAPAAVVAPEQKWEPLIVRADKTDLPIEEAQITRANGHHIVAIKDADFARFQQRMSKGVVAERVWRELHDGLATIKAEREAPQARSDAEIEATLIMEKVKPYLEQILNETEMELLEANIKLAQRTERDTHTTARSEYFATKESEANKPAAEAEAAAADEDLQVRGLVTEMLSIAKQQDDTKGMTAEQLRAAFGELVGVKRAVFWREGTDWFADRNLMYQTLQRHAKAAAAPVAPTTPAAPPANAGHTAPKAGTGDRFNAGVESAARTTSLKAGRTRPRGERPPRSAPHPSVREKDSAMIAEDKWRAKEKKFMASTTLDFDDDDEEDV